MPISEAAQTELLLLLGRSDDALPDHSLFAEPDFLFTGRVEQSVCSEGQIGRDQHTVDAGPRR